MEENIEISRKTHAIRLEKESGTKITYFLYPEFEIHQNVLPVGTTQDWHRHTLIEEVLVVTQGTCQIEFLEKHQIRKDRLDTGDVLRVKQSIHRILNKGEVKAHIIVFRFLPRKENVSQQTKTNKVDCEALVKQLFS